MRTARVAACAALLFAACIKRVAPDPGAGRTAVSGAPVEFAAPRELPEGTTVRWEFGDGTAAGSGVQVRHVFPRAGNFTVTQTLIDRDGERRSASSSVLVSRRGVAAAVPADVRAALIAERPWQRVRLQREAARRVGLGEFFDETARGVSDALGFDAQDPAAAEANGVDTDEGFALYTVPQDLEALVVCVGISDPVKAGVALRRLLGRPTRGAPFVLREAALPDGTPAVLGERAGGSERVAFLERLGYLYLRTPGPTDPLPALASAARLGSSGGLEQDAGFQAALARVGGGDAVFYSASPRPGEEAASGSRLAGQLGASAFAVQVAEDRVQLSVFAQLRSLTGKALVAALTPDRPPPDLAGRLPAGAAAFAKLSGEPVAVWRELVRGLGPDGPASVRRLEELLGAEVEPTLLPAFTGNGAVALYLDAQSLIEALLGEQVAAFDRSTFLGVAELVPGREAPLRSALDRAAREAGGGRPVRDATWWPISEGLQVALKGGFLFASLGGAVVEEGDDDRPPASGALTAPASPRFRLAAAGAAVRKKAERPVKGPTPRKPPAPPPEPTAAELGPLAAVLLAAPGAPMLARALSATGLPLEVPAAWLGFVDLHGVLERIDAAAQEQGGLVGAAVRLFVDRVRGLRDALVDARPRPDGIAATVTLRFTDPPTAGAPPAAAAPGAR